MLGSNNLEHVSQTLHKPTSSDSVRDTDLVEHVLLSCTDNAREIHLRGFM